MIFTELSPDATDIVFTDVAVYDPFNDIYYQPFVAADGRVGYKIGRTDDRPDAETFLYFNPSTSDANNGDDTPNVFVYIGGDNNPEHDEPLHFYTIADEDFGL